MKVIIAGDYCDRCRVKPLIEKGLYNDIFGYMVPVIRSADYAIVNFEMPIDNRGYKPIQKNGPTLKGLEKSVEAIKYIGFNLCTLANNHILDLGPDACLATETLINAAGIETTGIGKNVDDASKVKYVTIDNEVLAIINCCEHEFSIAGNDSVGACPVDPIRQYYQIQEAKSKSDYILIIAHGGHENFQYPSERMQKLYRFFIDAGADAVVNHHQHCVCGYERYQGKPIFYGLGNFCFDNPNGYAILWNRGILAEITFKKDGKPEYSAVPYAQCEADVAVKPLSDRAEFDTTISDLNNTIQNPVLLKRKLDEYYESRTKGMLTLFEPYHSRISNKLFRMGVLPKTMSKAHFLSLKNMIEYESHRDVLLYSLEKRYDKLNSK